MGTEREAEAAGRSLRTPANQEGGGSARAGGWMARCEVPALWPRAARLHSHTSQESPPLTLLRTQPITPPRNTS